MRIRLNGQERDVPDGATVLDLVLDLGLRPETVAVEVNGRVVPRDERGECPLEPGDRVEIVTLVGGG